MISFVSGKAEEGHGGMLNLTVGTGNKGDGGDVLFTAGEADGVRGGTNVIGGDVIITAGIGSDRLGQDGGNGGNVSITGGRAEGWNKLVDWGGNIELHGGRADASTGGSFLLHSGIGTATSSGLISIVTANAGVVGVSGSLAFSSGTTTKGNSGMIMIGTGIADGGKGGRVEFEMSVGNKGDGGNNRISAGETDDIKSTGGRVKYIAGLGSSTNSGDGGDGGPIYVQGGEARGKHFFDNGGNIELTGGLAAGGYGGSFLLETGYSFETSSGAITLATANAGKTGVSGHIRLTSGTASRGNSG
jgi:hypothetical protein